MSDDIIKPPYPHELDEGISDVVIDGTPADNEVLAYDSASGTWINQTAAEAGLSGGSGDVTGPAASVDNAIVRFHETTGKVIQDYTSGAPTIGDTGIIQLNANIDINGNILTNTGEINGRAAATALYINGGSDGVTTVTPIILRTGDNANPAVMTSRLNISADAAVAAVTWTNVAINYSSVAATNVNIDSGAIDGVTIGAAAAPTVTDLGSVATADINGGTIDGVTIGATAAPTVTDLGSVATADINGGTIDGVTIGASAAPTVTDLGSVATCDINGGTLGGVTLDGAMTMGETGILLDPVLSGDATYCGITEGGTAGATLAIGDICYLAVADTRWELAKADVAATSFGKLGMCVQTAAADGSATTMLLYGKIRAATLPALTVGAPVFLSAATAGDVTMTAPTGTTNFVVRIIGHGNTAEDLFFHPDNTYVELA